MCSAHGQEKNEKVEIAMESVGEGGSVCVSACVYIYIFFKRKKGHNYIFPKSLFRESLHSSALKSEAIHETGLSGKCSCVLFSS